MRAIRAPRTILAIVFVLIGGLATAWVSITSNAPKEANPSWPLSIAVVGDAYAAGSNNRVVWPTLLAQRTGWSVANFALPGAGFAADGQGGYAFLYQVDRALQAHPQVIVIASGVADDDFAGTGDIGQGALEAINEIKLGGQRALVIGPTWYETPVPETVTSVSEEIRKVAENAGVPYLDALDPPWLTPDLMQADLHGPTDEGQSAIADKVAAWLRTEVAVS
jgi:lysophospholipase L1-like esterase